ncbi:MAG: DUF3990 domain-containing protein [Lachnospiraceae bacterium]|nr:DUF3990 domain-containing protein [Lachnospiraceae bacterium]
MRINEDMILYHGSYTIVEKPELSKCRKGKDFGKGFYLTSSKSQAERFTKTAIRKAVLDGIIQDGTKVGYVSKYRVKSISELEIYDFKYADDEWLHCVVGHRKKNSLPDECDKWKSFDVISGKIANDNTNLVITAYMDGVYGEVGSKRADTIAIGFLEPQNLKDQFCFRTEKAISILEYIGNERVMI